MYQEPSKRFVYFGVDISFLGIFGKKITYIYTYLLEIKNIYYKKTYLSEGFHRVCVCVCVCLQCTLIEFAYATTLL